MHIFLNIVLGCIQVFFSAITVYPSKDFLFSEYKENSSLHEIWILRKSMRLFSKTVIQSIREKICTNLIYIIKYHASLHRLTVLGSDVWVCSNTVLISEFVVCGFFRKQAQNLLFIPYLLKLLLNFKCKGRPNNNYQSILSSNKTCSRELSITFIFTSHPLNRPSVIIMLTNRKRKHTDLRKLKIQST